MLKETLANKQYGLAWGRVCVLGNRTAAIGNVACRQLGYETFAAFMEPSRVSVLSHRRVALGVNSCRGDELKLKNCNVTTFPLSCRRKVDLAVVCASKLCV